MQCILKGSAESSSKHHLPGAFGTPWNFLFWIRRKGLRVDPLRLSVVGGIHLLTAGKWCLFSDLSQHHSHEHQHHHDGHPASTSCKNMMIGISIIIFQCFPKQSRSWNGNCRCQQSPWSQCGPDWLSVIELDCITESISNLQATNVAARAMKCTSINLGTNTDVINRFHTHSTCKIRIAEPNVDPHACPTMYEPWKELDLKGVRANLQRRTPRWCDSWWFKFVASPEIHCESAVYFGDCHLGMRLEIVQSTNLYFWMKQWFKSANMRRSLLDSSPTNMRTMICED